MSCHDPEVIAATPAPEILCADCPMAYVETVIDQYLENNDPDFKVYGHGALKAIAAGAVYCKGVEVEQRDVAPCGSGCSSCSDTAFVSVCGNTQMDVALELLSLDDNDRHLKTPEISPVVETSAESKSQRYLHGLVSRMMFP